MGLFGFLDLIFRNSHANSPAADEPLPAQQQGYFLREIASDTENRIGAFYCENKHCLTRCHRYIPGANESIADVMRCPNCGHWMLHDNLSREYFKQSEKVVRGSAGTRQIYEDALESLPLAFRIFTARSLVDSDDRFHHKQSQVPSFEVLLDLAPMIFDETTLTDLALCMEKLDLANYPAEMIPLVFARLQNLRIFYQQLEQGKTYKQVDLKKDFLSFYPEVGDPTWVFYVWSNFGFFKRTNVKNRVYLTKQSH